MKLNATAEMIPITWPEFSDVHPFAPRDQTDGYVEMISSLNADLCKITGFDAVSVQPNSGASGEYAGLLAIRAYQQSIGEGHRNVCLIPVSAHGTNPASAAMAGMRVIWIADNGGIDLEELRALATEHKDTLCAAMITYPSVCSRGANGWTSENSGHVTGIISAVALSFIVQEPARRFRVLRGFCDALTPSRRLVFISGCRGWSLFRCRGKCECHETAARA